MHLLALMRNRVSKESNEADMPPENIVRLGIRSGAIQVDSFREVVWVDEDQLDPQRFYDPVKKTGTNG